MQIAEGWAPINASMRPTYIYIYKMTKLCTYGSTYTHSQSSVLCVFVRALSASRHDLCTLWLFYVEDILVLEWRQRLSLYIYIYALKGSPENTERQKVVHTLKVYIDVFFSWLLHKAPWYIYIYIMWGNQSVGDARTTYDSAFSFMLFRIYIYRQKHTKHIQNPTTTTRRRRGDKTFCVGNNANRSEIGKWKSLSLPIYTRTP